MSNDQLNHLIKMINQIADNSGGGTDPEAVLNHIIRFWARPMKARIIWHLHRGGEGLNEIARQAVTRLDENEATLTALSHTEAYAAQWGEGCDAG